jgi:hypothetical protein
MDDKPPEREPLRPHHEATWTEIINVVKAKGGDVEKTILDMPLFA